MPLAYDAHPEFGYFSPGPRVRRELRVAVVSMLVGISIGAVIVTIPASRAVETDGVSRNAQLKSSAPDALVARVAGPSSNPNSVKADPAEAIKPYPMRMVRVRSGRAASPIAGIPLGQAAPAEVEIAPVPAGPASPEKGEASGTSVVSPQAKRFGAAAEPTVSASKRRPSAIHPKRHRDDENESTRWQSRRWPHWSERAYAEDRHWRGAYRNWVY